MNGKSYDLGPDEKGIKSWIPSSIYVPPVKNKKNNFKSVKIFVWPNINKTWTKLSLLLLKQLSIMMKNGYQTAVTN